MDLTRPPSPDRTPAWLSPDEAARAARFLRQEDRVRFIRSHQALRHILSGYLGRRREDLRFRTRHGGKPELDGPDRGRLAFNLSHADRHALIGIAQHAPIGVDIEALRPIGDPLSIARAHFHAGEIADLTCLPGPRRDAAFFACWTRKEAVVKALGTGLSHPLDAFRVSIPPAGAAVLDWQAVDDPGLAWTLHHLEPTPDTVGTVAIPRSDAPCARYRLAPTWAEPMGNRP